MTGTTPPTPNRRLALGLLTLGVLGATACSTPETETSGGEEPQNTANPLTVRISPEDGAADVRPDLPITVEAEGGTLTDVRVATAGQEGSGADEMTGSLNDDRTEWTSDWTLTPGADVTVTATAETADGESTEVTSAFSTLAATEGRRLELRSNFPTSGQTVGVGMPVIVEFDLPVQNKARVESAMEVISEEPVQGAWNWFGDQTAVFRPQEYWRPHQNVTVNLRLAGVQASDGVYGIENHQLDFTVGRSQISTIDEDTHRMTVERDGQQVKDFPTSIGKADVERYTTTSGVHLTMEKYEDLVMDSSTVGVPVDSPEGYKLEVQYAVRFSDSGEFTHAAPWNDRLGEANLSHGCPNLATADARWFYENSYMGDPLIVTGTDRELEVDNGWGYWQRSWDTWLANSATGTADDTGEPGTPGSPHGETE
ncbi:lipoprotein-anchoring transpeptidase ErfK/SrfK [Nocardiopsis arvandica]|uniref:Lipoprotein-anchoring transpeptidase ErfK/SrfK n=1 Tax=Nocardiopsis sinuspersici TaxID=501010 RepID=A0A7Z0BMU4_9ACTN|nr:Ig-like domain-containing protein [Nocardiopsis sinuspersici]NYH55620.1 lipoprotein-anchoring transpeptidase ErfK/SrfK [Nocardiopsis sinuspersici]